MIIKNIISKCKRIVKLLLFYPRYLLLKKSGEPDEIICFIDGGLSSQMGQYSLGQEIQRITGIQVSYDLTWFDKYGKDVSNKENRLYKLESVFPKIKVRRASKEKILIYKRCFDVKKSLIQNLDDIIISPPIFLGGYWYTKIYKNYKIENLRELYTFKLLLDSVNKQMLDKILSEECTVAIHIRLGDYIGTIHDVTTPQYFYNAIEYIRKEIDSKNIHFFVFSNDINRCKNILGSLPYIFSFVDINDNDHGEYDMYLMSNCHHFIISNSGVGYWPALLSDRSNKKIVIRPNKWFNKSYSEIENVMPIPGWIKMEY